VSGESLDPDKSSEPGGRLGRSLSTASFVLLLAVVTARGFVGETTLRSSALRPALAAARIETASAAAIDTSEIARLHFALLLLAAFALWAIGAVGRGFVQVRFGWLLGFVAAFAVLSLFSALFASDRRAALDGWVEQVAVLLAGFLALQLCGQRRRFAMVVVVLAALGAALAVKGLYQYFVEIPDRIADFRMYRAQRLAAMGWQADSPQARMLRIRLLDRAPGGFFSLVNLFASLMILLFGAAAGLALDKVVQAVRGRVRWAKRRKKGEVHVPTVGAVVSVAVAASVLVVLVLTGSVGAIGAKAAAAATGMFIAVLGRRAALHWSKLLAVFVAVLILAGAAVVVVGLRYDRLPTRTMTYRWYYWSGAAQVIREHPCLGVGEGNFDSAYLPHRRPEAEEEVKAPHNLIVGALVRYGVPGGVCYLGVLAILLGAMTRPERAGPVRIRLTGSPRGRIPAEVLAVGVLAVVVISTLHMVSAAGTGGTGWAAILGFCAVVLAAVAASRFQKGYLLLVVGAAPLLARTAYRYAGGGAALYVLDVFLPVLVFWIALAALIWVGESSAGGNNHGPSGDRGAGVVGRFSRLALACGAGGFVLHNMVTYSLWSPATATAFWVVLGACVAQAGARGGRSRRWAAWPLALCAASLPIVCLMGVARPVIERTRWQTRAVQAAPENMPRAAHYAAAAAAADPLDAIAASDAARAYEACSLRDDRTRRLQEAMDWAREAIRRDPASYVYWRLAGRIALEQSCPGVVRYRWRPVSGDLHAQAQALRRRLAKGPADVGVLVRLSHVECARGRFAEAVAVLQRAIELSPDCAALYLHLGDLRHRTGQLAAARQTWAEGLTRCRLEAGEGSPLRCFAQAVARNPQATRLRLGYAEVLFLARRYDSCLGQVEAALAVDRALPAESVERLSPTELDRLGGLRARAQGMRGLDAATSPAGDQTGGVR